MKEKMKEKMKRIVKIIAKVTLVACVLVLGNNTVFATNDPLTVISNLETFIFDIIKGIGVILMGWGVVQIGLALKSHDPSQRANGFFSLAGGIVLTFAKQILDLITGG